MPPWFWPIFISTTTTVFMALTGYLVTALRRIQAAAFR